MGQPGECVEIWAKTGRELILKHKAVYPTPENKEKYRDATALNIMNYSSRYVKNVRFISIYRLQFSIPFQYTF